MKAILVVLSVIFGSFSVTHAFAYCEIGEQKTAKDFERAQKSLDRLIARFANQNPSASRADHTLSLLISKNSRTVRDWIKKRDAQGMNDEDIAKAWRIYFAKNMVLTKFPQNDPELNRSVQVLLKKIEREIFTAEKRNRILKIFNLAKKAALASLQKFQKNSSSNAFSQITKRVGDIKLSWLGEDMHSKSPLEFISWGAAYDPEPNEINIGVDILKYENDETLFAVFAHEIGHSFDSCRWGAYFGGINPFREVIQCLRSSESVGAKARDDAKLESWASSAHAPADLVKSLKENPTCNKTDYPPEGTQADQIPEAFSDWFSAEVVSNSDFVTPHLRSDLCENGELKEGSSYLPNRTRLEKIYLAQPKIRSRLNLPAQGSIQYCGFIGS